METSRIALPALLLGLAFVFPGSASGQSLLAHDRYEGGSMVIPANVKINENSNLNREWHVLRDERAPVQIDGKTGIDVAFDSENASYSYSASYTLKALEPVTAWDIHYVVLDVFGNVIRTLANVKVTELASNFANDNPRWRICTEAEASEAFASVAYVASARLATRRIYAIDRAAVLQQIREIAPKATDSNLDPSPRKQRGAAGKCGK
jgi:hypothetical protein